MLLFGLALLMYPCFGNAIKAEVCVWETFNASCAAWENVHVESAVIGRMRSNRCINQTENETECYADVRHDVQKQLRQVEQIRLSDDFLAVRVPSCLKRLMPYLEISYRCSEKPKTEVCIWETLEASCRDEKIISIQYALFGRVRSSRCIDFETEQLGCFSDVQRHFERRCNRRNSCSIKPSEIIDTSTPCQNVMQYLDILYKCTYEYDCVKFNAPEDVTIEDFAWGHRLSCVGDKNVSWEVHCINGNWITKTQRSCATDRNYTGGLSFWQKVAIYVTMGAIALIIFLAIVALFTNRRRQRNNQRDSSGYCEFEEIQPGSIDNYEKIVPEAVPESPGKHPPAFDPLQPLPKPPSPPQFSTPTNQGQRVPQSHIYLPLLPEDGPATQPQPK